MISVLSDNQQFVRSESLDYRWRDPYFTLPKATVFEYLENQWKFTVL